MDSRALYSKRLIRKSFEELLHEKPLSRITLTEVCKRAGINRSTFYRYYDGVSDWCEQIRREYTQGESPIVQVCKGLPLREQVTHVYNHMQENLYLFKTLLTEREQVAVLTSVFGSSLVHAPSEWNDMILTFVLQGFFACVSKQLTDPRPVDTNRFLDEMSKLILLFKYNH